MDKSDPSALLSDAAVMQKLLAARMPYGKYAGRLLLDLPEHYVVWFARKGFPKGEFGMLLNLAYEIKLNGLEPLLRPLRMPND
jgi:uncharacterized protein (DUF3820 family)